MTISVQKDQIEFSKTNLTLRELYSECPNLYNEGCSFADKSCRNVDPITVLYVRQKEDAVTYDGDEFGDGKKVEFCGTEDVLTCHVVILHHPEARVTSIGHFDEYVREVRLKRFVSDFRNKVLDRLSYEDEEDETDFSDEDEWEWEVDDEEEIMNQTHLKLIGGYEEVSRKSKIISTRILSFFSKDPISFQLKLCCLGKANTQNQNSHAKPKVGGVVCRVKDGQTFPASFQRSFVNQLPDETIRTLMLGPSLIKKPNKLKQMILAKEDQGFAKAIQNQGPIKQSA